MSRFRDWAKIFQNPCFSGYHVILYPSLKNCHKNVKLSHSNNNINTFLFQRQPIHGHYHWQDEHMPAWLHHPVEKSHHSTWKYYQSSKYNERVFLIFISWYILCNPCQVLTACTSLYSIVSIGISFLDLHAEWQGPNLSVHFRARCSPYLLRKSWLYLRVLISKGFQWVCKECKCTCQLHLTAQR